MNCRTLVMNRVRDGGPAACLACVGICWILLALSPLALAGEPTGDALSRTYEQDVRPLVRQYCHACHSAQLAEAEIDFEPLARFAEARRQVRTWERVAEVVSGRLMPPTDSPQPSADERARLQAWLRAFLTAEARTRAGDPGPVVLRRLSNAEYTYTLRDLAGVPSLDPAREFPVDGAAGEGFTNAGNALVMSPTLLTKYLDAAKEVAGHAVLLPDGFRFSPHTTRADWTNDTLARIREFYGQYTDSAGGNTVNLQGIVFDTNQGGRLPVEQYLAATLAERAAVTRGEKTIEAVARERGLSPKYLGGLWKMLTESRPDPAAAAGGPVAPSLLLDGLRARWRTADPKEGPALAADIARWQQALWRFTSVGHIGKLNGPKAWMEPVDPLTARQDFQLKLLSPSGAGPNSKDSAEVLLYLTAGDAGDGNAQDFVVWERPRLVAPGRPDVLLRDVRAVTRELTARRTQLTATAAPCLEAAAEASAAQGELDVKALAQRHGVAAESLSAWLNYLGIVAAGPAKLGPLIERKSDSSAGYGFVQGWVGDDALSVLANSSDQLVRIPGTMNPHSIAVHPSPKRSVAVGWRSPVAASLRIAGSVQHAHPDCGNGIAWSLEVRRGHTTQRLAAGTNQAGPAKPFGPLDGIAIRPGDVVALVVNPRDGDHSCDLTALDLTLTDGSREWNLTRDLSPNILAGNPHPDGFGNTDVWHFFSEPANGSPEPVIPAGSLLARWQSAGHPDEQRKLADELQQLLRDGAGTRPHAAPDSQLYQQLTSLSGPLMSAAWRAIAAQPAATAAGGNSSCGLDPALFGKHPSGDAAGSVDPASLCVQAASVIQVRLPADLVAGAEFVTAGTLHAPTGSEGSVQLQVLTTKPEAVAGLQPTAVAETNAGGPWTSNNRGVSHATPVVVVDGSTARRRFEAAFADFRRWFPTALCYTRIVPVDEVVTLTLFYREDDHLRRLMLDEGEAAQLDRLWDELHFVSLDALKLVDAFEQLWQYATQDADPKVFEPLRQPILDRAVAFRQQLNDAEPRQLAALLEFAARVYRRPLSESETRALSDLYGLLRRQGLPHDEAFRLVLARLFVSPAFLYRAERIPAVPPGQPAAAGATLAQPVSDFELATRLSYFLWSSLPDEELLDSAAGGRLQQDEELIAQTRRLRQDPRAGRLAAEFATQWLHIYQFDAHDEKSPAAFPTFAGLRGAMQEEFLRFFTDLVQRDGSILELLEADHTFVNDALAEHYGIPGVSGPDWRRVEGLRQLGRGGILGMAAPLAKQAGASRTSPILRGNWVSEVLLGEKTPKPPQGVPPLPETVPAGLTERQMIERHTADAACAKCHARIDPFGFALEGFDAIGRARQAAAGAPPLNTRAKLFDGTEVTGLDGLRTYLATTRREHFVRYFCRKLLGYSLGRAVQLTDEPLLDDMLAALQADGYRFGVAVEAIVHSPQFRQVRVGDAEESGGGN